MKITLCVILISAVVLFDGCSPSPKPLAVPPPLTEFPFTTKSMHALEAFKKALDLQATGDWKASQPLIEQALTLDSNFYVADLFIPAYTFAEFKANVQRANRGMDKVSEGEKLLIEYFNSMVSNDVDKRLNIAQTMVSKYPKMPRVHVLLGNTYANQLDVTKARESYQKAVEVDSAGFVGYAKLGESYLFYEPKDFSKALSYCTKVIERRPQSSGAFISVGNCYRAMNELDKAKEQYSRALSADSTDATTYMVRGHINSFIGEYEAAQADYTRASALDPSAGRVDIFEMSLPLYAGNPKESFKIMEKKLEALEKAGLSRDKLLERKLGILDAGRQLALHVNDQWKLKALNEKYTEVAGEYISMVKDEETTMFEKYYALYWNGVASALRGDFKNADTLAAQMKIIIEPAKSVSKLDYYHFLKGLSSFKQRKYEDAVTAFTAAIAAQPSNVYFKYCLGKAFEKLNNTQRAEEQFSMIENHNFNDFGYSMVRKELKERKKPV